MDRKDVWHERVRDWFAAATKPVFVPSPVVVEAAWLLGDRFGPRAEAALLRAVASGEFVLEPVNESDLDRAAELVEAYSDFPLGYVDASVVAIGERLGVGTLLTTDRRHFGVVRPAHRPGFVLAP